MKPEDLDHDSLLQALSALPREDLDAWRSERLRIRAHAELTRSQHPLARAGSAVELLLMAACGILGVGRLVMALAVIFGH